MDIDSLFDSLEDITLLQESIDIECKLAGGKDGKGQLPEDFWKTYSSFANTRGGYIILGLKEKNNSFNVVGIENIQKVKDEFFNLANNTEKVNVNLLNDDDIIEKIFDNKTVLIFNIPFALKQQKPVYIKSNMKYTYKRNATGDYLCSDAEIEAMIRDKSPESIDSKILENFGIEDFNTETIRSYRQIYANLQPNNRLIDFSEQEFLIEIGALKKIEKQIKYLRQGLAF